MQQSFKNTACADCETESPHLVYSNSKGSSIQKPSLDGWGGGKKKKTQKKNPKPQTSRLKTLSETLNLQEDQRLNFTVISIS